MLGILDTLPPLTFSAVLVAIVLLGIVVGLIRTLAGPPAEIARRGGLLALRGSVILCLAALLVNPVEISEAPGRIERPEAFFVVDTSASMSVGGDDSRWQQALNILNDSANRLESSSVALKYFRFGNRLSSIEGLAQLGNLELGGEPIQPASLGDTPGDRVVLPLDKDTRLTAALTQIRSRFGRTPPRCLVVFSDGRARYAEALQAAAAEFADLGIPIHVVPVGRMEEGGDVALIGALLPESVREHARVEVQVFLRSYGFEGQRVQVRLLARHDDGTPPTPLIAPVPLVLTGGVQTLSLAYRAEENASQLQIEVEPLPNEASLDNNSVTAETLINHTKIRILYIEGSPQLPRGVRRGDEIVIRGAYTDLQEALSSDPDIECVTLSTAFGRLRHVNREGNLDQERGFPKSPAELAAFDVLILSSVAREVFSDEQLSWLDRWIGERGAGFCMLGGPDSFASGGWSDSPVEKLLPVRFDKEQWIASPTIVPIIDDHEDHPLFQVVSNAKLNAEILSDFPQFTGVNQGLKIKPSLATILASGQYGNEEIPLVNVGRYGKGRTMAMACGITAPWANELLNDWGEGDNRYYQGLWRNVVYWLAENSQIGRRRLIIEADKKYYRPGDHLSLRAYAFDESANLTQQYRLVAMVEPKNFDLDAEALYSPILWPNRDPREEGLEGPLTAWGEEFTLDKLPATSASEKNGYGINLDINRRLTGGVANEGLRIEVTAYEDETQVDSTSIQLQLMADPFEHRNPYPNHPLLESIAKQSGGTVIQDSDKLVNLLTDLPVTQGASSWSKRPLWSNWWVWTMLIGLLTIDWIWRRKIGLA